MEDKNQFNEIINVGKSNISATPESFGKFCGLIDRVVNGQSVLLESDPNTGKTVASLFAAWHYARQGKIVIVAPNRNAVSEQIVSNAYLVTDLLDDKTKSAGRALEWYCNMMNLGKDAKTNLVNNTLARFGDYKLPASKVSINKGQVIIASVDGMLALTENLLARGVVPILIIDEHQESYEMSKRIVYSQLMDLGVAILGMSGTCDREAIHGIERFYTVKIVSEKPQATIRYTLQHGLNSEQCSVERIKYSIKTGRGAVWFENDTDKLEKLYKRLTGLGFKGCIVRSKERQIVKVDQENYQLVLNTQEFLKTGKMGDLDFVLGTSSLVAGLNIEDTDRQFDIYAVMCMSFSDHHCLQLSKRIRESYSAINGIESIDVNIYLLTGQSRGDATLTCENKTTSSFYEKAVDKIEDFKKVARQVIAQTKCETDFDVQRVLKPYNDKKCQQIFGLSFDFFEHIKDFTALTFYDDTIKKIAYLLYTQHISKHVLEFAAKVSQSDIDEYGFVTSQLFDVDDWDNSSNRGQAARVKLYTQGADNARRDFLKLAEVNQGQGLLDLLKATTDAAADNSVYIETARDDYDLGYADQRNSMVIRSNTLRILGQYNMVLLANTVSHSQQHYEIVKSFLEDIEEIRNLDLDPTGKQAIMSQRSQLVPIFLSILSMVKNDDLETLVFEASDIKEMITHVFTQAHSVYATYTEITLNGEKISTYGKSYPSGATTLFGTQQDRKALIDVFLTSKRTTVREDGKASKVYALSTTEAFEQMRSAFLTKRQVKSMATMFGRTVDKPVKVKRSLVAPQLPHDTVLPRHIDVQITF